MHRKTLILIEAALEVLSEYNPMTLRQVYYQLVARHIIDNRRSEYQRLSGALVKARQEGLVPWEWLEDRVRQPQVVSMWRDLPDFLKTVRHAYRKDIWGRQPQYVEAWLEKDALSGIFAAITQEYGVTLVVGRGYNSWSAYKEAAGRFEEQERPVVILYFGDFDPSGEDIVRALRESLNFFGTSPRIEKVALTLEDVVDYNLPPDFTKETDSRSKKFVQRYGDLAVELDALPVPVLQEKIRTAIEENLDLSQLDAIREIEGQEAQRLKNLSISRL
jgi:DNA topoisomerase VI subunit A